MDSNLKEYHLDSVPSIDVTLSFEVGYLTAPTASGLCSVASALIKQHAGALDLLPECDFLVNITAYSG